MTDVYTAGSNTGSGIFLAIIVLAIIVFIIYCKLNPDQPDPEPGSENRKYIDYANKILSQSEENGDQDD